MWRKSAEDELRKATYKFIQEILLVGVNLSDEACYIGMQLEENSSNATDRTWGDECYEHY